MLKNNSIPRVFKMEDTKIITMKEMHKIINSITTKRIKKGFIRMNIMMGSIPLSL